MPALTERQIRGYAEAFVETLQAAARQYLEPGLQEQLYHSSRLPATITCYLSTQFGLGFEYTPATDTTVRVRRGSARIEDLFLGAPSRLRRANTAIATAGGNTGLFNVTTRDLYPFRLTSGHASIHIHDCEFTSGAWQRRVFFAELFANREAADWSPDAARLRAVAEVLAAATEVTRARLRDISIAEYIAEHKKKTVLVLGSYHPAGRARLGAIAAELSRHDYEPVFVDSVPDHPHHSLAQKVTALGSIARFVLVDDSEASGHIAELEICKSNNWVTAILRCHGIGASWMTAGSAIYTRVIYEGQYDPPPVAAAVDDAVSWAESCIGEISHELGMTYPWRRIDPAA